MISLLFPDKMHPNHLWHPSRSTTATFIPLGIVIVFGGWACVVSNFVLPPSKSNRRLRSKSNRRLPMQPRNHQASMLRVAMMWQRPRCRPQTFRSCEGPPPSSKSTPSALTRILRLPKTHSNTERKVGAF